MDSSDLEGDSTWKLEQEVTEREVMEREEEDRMKGWGQT